jgi:long-chain acyl-CoA synthetase
VPRLFNKIYGTITEKFKEATGCKGWLIRKALETKMENYKAGEGVTHKFYDALVFNKIKAILGGNVRLMITGSAPIAAEVLEFLKICFCAPICEGYGMTESAGGSFMTHPDDNQPGIVGGPMFNIKLRLRDIPEMGYLS